MNMTPFADIKLYEILCMSEGSFFMADNNEKKGRRLLRRPSRRALITLGIIALAGALAFGAVSTGFMGIGGGKNVKFTQLPQDKIPRTIEKDVIPEYRDLERALGCLVDGKVYAVVTRGEKPTAGYDLSIEKMKLDKTKEGTNLVVTALFTEPSTDTAVSQIITYPYVVAETELEALPNTIELAVRYAE